MQASALSIGQIKDLIVDRAGDIDRNITPESIDVHEDPYAADDGALIIQIVAERPADARIWTERRLRFSQSVRDLLLEYGEHRYPVLQFFGRDEWAGRND